MTYLAKADLHLHSKASNQPAGWLSMILGCQESHTEPKVIYKKLKERGMDYITITDHNTIDGVLEIANMPDVFISCEYTVKFPYENAKVHVLVYGIDEELHKDLIKLKENVYEFIKYLKDKAIAHSLAHPLYSVEDTKITKSLVEKFVLLFDNWEIINGTRGENLKNLEAKLAKYYYGWEKIMELEEKHNIPSLRTREFIGSTAGTDDHGGVDMGRTWTQALASTKEEFLSALKNGTTSIASQDLGYERLMNTVGGVCYSFFKKSNAINGNIRPFLDFVFMEEDNVSEGSFMKVLLDSEKPRHLMLKDILNNVPFVAFDRLLTQFSTTTFGEFVLSSLAHFIPLYFVSRQKKEEDNARDLLRKIGADGKINRRLAYVTDTYFEINGVAGSSKTINKLASIHKLPIDIITMGKNEIQEKVITLRSMKEFPMPFYHEYKLRFPSLIELLDILKNYTHVHVATPGPLGLMAFMVAKVLNLNLTFAFHTDIPMYVYNYTQSESLKNLLYKAISILCNLSDITYVPSLKYAKVLMELGVKIDKIRIFKRGVDTQLFNPIHREEKFFEKNFSIQTKNHKILYVGRVSKEKNIDIFIQCAKVFPNDTFIMVGDGPYRAELERAKPENVYLVGYLSGIELSKAYASADIFLFPSGTETYGLVTLEAMASGLPVIVSSKGASPEHIKEGVNGFTAHTTDEFVAKLDLLISSPSLREQMAKEAVSYARSLDLKETYLSYLNILLGFEGKKYEDYGHNNLLSQI